MRFQDYHVIIVWNSNQNLINIIKDRFDNNFIYSQIFNLSINDRINKIKTLYASVPVRDDDSRLKQTEPITLFLLKLKPNYHFEWRTEGYRLCNKEILDFKREQRQVFDYTIFHCSDNIIETQHALRVFELNQFCLPGTIVHTNDLYHLIHDGYNYIDNYVNQKFKIVPIKDSPVVRYLLGYKSEYLNGSHLFNPRESSIEYHTKLGLTQSHPHSIITVTKYKDKYIVLDGMHRSSILYFNGDRYLFVHYLPDVQFDEPFFNYLNDDNIKPHEACSHLENLHELIFRLNNANIRYITIRGFYDMPSKPCSDLDIVVHPDDFERFIAIMKEAIKENRLTFEIEKIYNHPDKKMIYRSYKTTGLFGEHLPNNCYQMDIYNDVFFFKSDTEGHLINDKFRTYVFNTIQKLFHLNIPNVYAELVLLHLRIMIDKHGMWSDKHKNRTQKLINSSDFKIEEFFNVLTLIYNE